MRSSAPSWPRTWQWRAREPPNDPHPRRPDRPQPDAQLPLQRQVLHRPSRRYAGLGAAGERPAPHGPQLQVPSPARAAFCQQRRAQRACHPAGRRVRPAPRPRHRGRALGRADGAPSEPRRPAGPRREGVAQEGLDRRGHVPPRGSGPGQSPPRRAAARGSRRHRRARIASLRRRRPAGHRPRPELDRLGLLLASCRQIDRPRLAREWRGPHGRGDRRRQAARGHQRRAVRGPGAFRRTA